VPPVEKAPSTASRWASDIKMLDAAQRASDSRTTLRLLSELRELAPNNPQIPLALARIAAERGDVAEGVRWLGQYAAAGMTLGPQGAKVLGALASDPRTPQVAEQFAANGRAMGAALMAFALPTGDKLFEDIAWDPRSRIFYLSSVRDRRVYSVDAAGNSVRPVTAPEPEGIGVSGLAFDETHRVLWMSTAALPLVPGYRKGDDSARASSVASIDISTGQVTQRIELPADGKPHALTDIAVSATGDVMASDATAGGLYIVRRGRAVLERLSSDFDSPQTPAPRDDTTVYVPDYSLGIARVDTRSGAISWLSAAPEIALSGIDGLYLVKGTLIAIQNGTQPPRVVRLALSPDGTSVVAATVLAASPDLGEPTHGAIVDDDLWFLARSGWSRFDTDGTLLNDAPADQPEIWRVPYGGSPGHGPPSS
jgi:hypothetical protein